MYRDELQDGAFELATSKQETENTLINAAKAGDLFAKLHLTNGETFFLRLTTHSLFAIGISEASDIVKPVNTQLVDANNRKIN